MVGDALSIGRGAANAPAPAPRSRKQPTASWGNLLGDAPGYYTIQPWLMVWPGLAVLITTLAFNLLGDGLRDAFDPRATH